MDGLGDVLFNYDFFSWLQRSRFKTYVHDILFGFKSLLLTRYLTISSHLIQQTRHKSCNTIRTLIYKISPRNSMAKNKYFTFKVMVDLQQAMLCNYDVNDGFINPCRISSFLYPQHCAVRSTHFTLLTFFFCQTFL